MSTRTTLLDGQIQTLQARLADLFNQREVAALRLVEAVGDESALEASHAVEAALTKAQTEINHLRHARNAAARFDAIQERADRLAGLQAQRKELFKLARERVVVGMQIEDEFTRVKVLLQQFQALTDKCRTGAQTFAVDAMGRDAFILHGHTLIAAAAAETGGVEEALACAMVAAGIGTVGPKVRELEALARQYDPRGANVKDAIAMDADRLDQRLGQLISQVEADHRTKNEIAEEESERRLHALGAAGDPQWSRAARPLPNTTGNVRGHEERNEKALSS